MIHFPLSHWLLPKHSLLVVHTLGVQRLLMHVLPGFVHPMYAENVHGETGSDRIAIEMK